MPRELKQAGNYYRDEKQDFAKAVLNYQEAIRMEPKVAYTYNGLAKAYLDQAFRLDPKLMDFKQQQNELILQAIQSYNSALRLDSINGRPDQKIAGEIIVNRGVAYAVIGNMDFALRDLNTGLKVNPENTNGYLNRALIYFNMNQYELSLKDDDAYLKLNTFNADIVYGRGLCKFALNRTEESITDFSNAIALKNTQPLFYLARSKAYRKLGNVSASVNDARQAKQMGADVPPELFQ